MDQDSLDRDELTRIASILSRQETAGAVSYNTDLRPDAPSIDDSLNPDSPKFELDKWLTSFVKQVVDAGHNPRGAGIVFRDLSVHGTGKDLQWQETVGSVFKSVLRPGDLFTFGQSKAKHILHDFDGLLRQGEMLIVLGRPGSGCSTFLKTLCGETHGLSIDTGSTINFDGISHAQMQKEFKGEAIYNQEVDRHFPHLTVGQTLEFAVSARTPSHRIQGMSRAQYCRYIAKIVMAVLGLSHTYNTKVGDDFIRGVSGGERKRVSIAEMMVAMPSFAAWDNSTRGLDSASALKFTESLRKASDIGGRTNAVAIYQASQAIYDLFDKATVLYEGRQIYFGPASKAKAFFEAQGWFCPRRQTTGDFLTSLTNPIERTPRKGMEDKVPKTAADFEKYWRDSPEYRALRIEMSHYEEQFVSTQGDNPTLKTLQAQKAFSQAKRVRNGSPYLINTMMQVGINTKRAYQRIWNDMTASFTNVMVSAILSLIIGSIFYGTPDATAGFYSKTSVLFMAVLLNALTAISEITSLYAQRPIVEKQSSYAFYHPFTEAAAGIMSDVPVKFASAVVFNLIIYFMAGLRREPSQFFIFFLINYVITFVMIAIFRTMAAVTKTVSQALSLAGVMILALVIYTGFVIPVPSMHPWFSWIRWINPVYYAFEALVANEFHGRQFTCSDVVPPYGTGNSWVCAVAGAVPGESFVDGDAYISASFEYSYSHLWRNFGILMAFLIAFLAAYFTAVELNASTASTAEVLVFQRNGAREKSLAKAREHGINDEEKGSSDGSSTPTGTFDRQNVQDVIKPQTDIFTWHNVTYDIEIKGEPRRLLDNVTGWVKPGTLTALMGVSGAGKTTLLDVLAQRTSIGVITGDMFVNGQPRDASFQRKTGYVQQQDLHLPTATVRESLRFSADVRQPASVGQAEKYDFVEKVITMLDMQDFADAVVGSPGQGLNVEQRKLLSIGVELAARPKLLLFLDEPTSGLDSQSSWAICSLLRKLADAGQAVLCTIHQPSAILFQEFDRLLFLAKGGRTVYFGNIGADSKILLDYFHSKGAPRPCDPQENPAEYMLEIVNGGGNSHGEDWHSVWKASDEYRDTITELDRLHGEGHSSKIDSTVKQDAEYTEFAIPFTHQLRAVTVRIFQQYWRLPSYIFSKWILAIASGLFIGFTFYHANSSQIGMRNVIFAVFMVTTIFTSLVQQIQPLFITQRELYEVRERPSKAYSWQAFLLANVIVEFPFQIISAVLAFVCFYYPVMGPDQSSDRQGLVLLFMIQLFLYGSVFAHMTVVAMPDAQSAGGIVTFLTMMSTIFSGVLQTRTALPGFWVFMYRVSPFTYWIAGIVATQLHGREIDCSADEMLVFDPPQGYTCEQYLGPMLQQATGTLQNPNATSNCQYCAYQNADQYLSGSDIYWTDRWRDFGIMWAFVVANIGIAILLYYIFRVRKWSLASLRAKRGH
ncbi:hypothetical protein PFICI_02641 [Pestalotiopsis fici W106-1]|uniref:ABC transporter domain-containing protein n=1 Tax=Pestalotiopsis fici (strain W106-1 / CGMCC3.15140) TaxID=1229662 RepID=W3XHB2_PESFW|nr:uncharacterized protein PFICI_02641 [Pestalotiopsis fici W106-1]ETS84616.1 hypothetical protein PFICI_02641 [Pestalotiopsis fici W106-1]